MCGIAARTATVTTQPSNQESVRAFCSCFDLSGLCPVHEADDQGPVVTAMEHGTPQPHIGGQRGEFRPLWIWGALFMAHPHSPPTRAVPR